MKQKYLAVALSAALVASLTACGSDSKSNYAPSTPTPAPTPAPAPEPAPTPAPDAGGQTGTATGTPANDAVVINNTPAVASLGGSLALKTSVGTQHYIRNEESGFDTVANPNFNSTGSVANFDTLANTDMANIVVARTTPLRVDGRLDVYVGTPNNDRTDNDALQEFNTQDFDLSNVSDKPEDNNGLVAILTAAKGVDGATVAKLVENKTLYTDSVIQYRTDLLTVNVGKEETQLELTGRNNANSYEGATRIFGTNFHDETARPSVQKDDKDNIRVYVGDKQANRIARRVNNQVDLVGNVDVTVNNDQDIHSDNNLKFFTDKIKLDKVQFGRVTTNLENVSNLTNDDVTVEINGRKYFGIDKRNASTYLNVGRNNSRAVNNYFYRGLDETNLTTNAQTGTANYQGQALMYGLDNSYRGVGRKAGENSNAILEGGVTGAKDMLGNFVEARVNFDTKKVVGEVYNVWRLNEIDARTTKHKVATAAVVNFQGDVVGPNSIWGTAQRTYDVTNPVIADFQGNFFGANAEELGGSFNSVRRTAEGVAKYGDATWGGVFGAKKRFVGADGYTTE